LLLDGAFAELLAPCIGCARQVAKVDLVGGVVDGRDPVGVAVPDRVQADGFADAVVNQIGDLPRIVERTAGDRLGQDDFRVVAGDLDAAQ
jgi:hypothetical protein